uniref:FadR/GntR family transcriptional regulator n=1 Tax=Pararhizobium sp. IMCC3301 TaxID=3067904 RepID=UPI0027429032|nr:FCD domain-containing protein [Pararhizobium sp. IMCC3301]
MDTLSLLRDHVREGLEHGSYGTGHRIAPERDLADMFGTSRSAIRQALAVLEMEKIVVRKVGRGTFILPEQIFTSVPAGTVQSDASPSELMTARELFEPALVKLVVLNATDGDIRKLRDLVEQQKCAGPALEFEAGDIALHRAIAVAARNTLLMDLAERILSARRNSDWRKLKASVARRKPERRLQAIVEHERIILALENRDADAAGAAMRSHLESVRYNLIDTQY